MLGKIIFSQKIENVQYYAYDNHIFNVIYPDIAQINYDMVRTVDELIEKLRLPKQCIVAEFPSFVGISHEAQAYLASKEAKKCYLSFRFFE